MLINYLASKNLILEGADISNAYLNGNMVLPVLREQHTDSSHDLVQLCCVLSSLSLLTVPNTLSSYVFLHQ